MLAVRDIGSAAAKWVRNASVAGTSYTEGIQSPRRDQSTAAIAAEPAYEAGVQAGIARKAFSRGLREAGSDKWARGALEKGAVRFGPGVAASAAIYQSRASRYFDNMRSLTLGPRGMAGDPRNYERSKQVGNSNHALKVGSK